MWAERQAIEVFHLMFLRGFGARVDKALFVLKGGCNLRFFHRSVRYSEDIDLDIRTLAPGTLRNNVEAVLASQTFRLGLRTQKISIQSFTAPKQTSTTKRWKISLQVGDAGIAIPTKIEFSRRTLDAGALVAPVDNEIIRRYRLYPVIVQHYDASAALLQKIAALALRNVTQARDVFDLDLLRDAGRTPALDADHRQYLAAAIGNAMKVSYDEFVGQVVAYLEPEQQSDYANRKAWEGLQERVVGALRELQT